MENRWRLICAALLLSFGVLILASAVLMLPAALDWPELMQMLIAFAVFLACLFFAPAILLYRKRWTKLRRYSIGVAIALTLVLAVIGIQQLVAPTWSPIDLAP
jgi:membrane protease YdiL (CAAX protease family)